MTTKVSILLLSFLGSGLLRLALIPSTTDFPSLENPESHPTNTPNPLESRDPVPFPRFPLPILRSFPPDWVSRLPRSFPEPSVFNHRDSLARSIILAQEEKIRIAGRREFCCSRPVVSSLLFQPSSLVAKTRRVLAHTFIIWIANQDHYAYVPFCT